MARDIYVRFLDAERSRAEVTVVYDPSWLARWFDGARPSRRVTIVAYHKRLLDWVYEVDSQRLDGNVEDFEIKNAVEWKRRWDAAPVADLPSARTVAKPRSGG